MKETVGRVALGAFAAWMVPVVAAQFVPDWHWGVGGFAMFYVLFFLVGMAYALIARRMGVWSYKVAVAMALAAGFVLGWSTLIYVSESDNPANFTMLAALVVGVAGALWARGKASGMAWALFAMALTVALVAVLRPVGEAGRTTLALAVNRCGYVVVFMVSGLLFRHAARWREGGVIRLRA